MIIGISSDIGAAIAKNWLQSSIQVVGTFRQSSSAVEALGADGASLLPMDLLKDGTALQTQSSLRAAAQDWDSLVVATGNLEPIGLFEELDFDAWKASFEANFLSQLQVLHHLLPVRSRAQIPSVIFFAGGGTNGPTERFSAYTLAKIALIKAVELLDWEMQDVKFSIVGPGWVKTKIHQATLAAGRQAGSALDRTEQMLSGGQWTSMESVVSCCNWLINSPKSAVGGRNISVAHDSWESGKLGELLMSDRDLFKLRRKSMPL